MTLDDWAKAGWLKKFSPSKQQIAALFSVIDRDIEDSRLNLSPDGRFNIAYNAALQLCTIVLLAEGWKSDKLNAHHRTIAALPLILGKVKMNDAHYLDTCRSKRNGLEYDSAGRVTKTEAQELRAYAIELREDVIDWLKRKHPDLSPWESTSPKKQDH